MKKIILSIIILLTIVIATPVSAVGFREWNQAVNDIIELQEKCSSNQTEIETLTVKVNQLEQENYNLKNRVGILESLFNQLKGLLLQIFQMLSGLIK
jgi:peptidoglycan hydrolase CwlO-like protein